MYIKFIDGRPTITYRVLYLLKKRQNKGNLANAESYFPVTPNELVCDYTLNANSKIDLYQRMKKMNQNLVFTWC